MAEIICSRGYKPVKTSSHPGSVQRPGNIPVPSAVSRHVLLLLQSAMLPRAMRKPERRHQSKQPWLEFSVCYVTTYSTNVFLPPNLHIYSFLAWVKIVLNAAFQNVQYNRDANSATEVKGKSLSACNKLDLLHFL